MNARSGLNNDTRRAGWIPQGICVNTATTLERREDPTTCAGNVKMVFSFLAGSRPVLFPTMELNVNPKQEGEIMEEWEGAKFLRYLEKGYCSVEARDTWSAKTAVEKGLGEFRIGKNIMYLPDADIEVNRNLHSAVKAISSL
jgi:hypothetical protein